jgi:mannose-6-phosphate isomerase
MLLRSKMFLLFLAVTHDAMNTLYPLKFTPIFKEKIWGGVKIGKALGFDFSPLINCGEMWVLSGVEDDESVVANGFLKGNTLNEVVEIYMGDLVGDTVFEKYGNMFPVLVKIIDTNDYLSIQVHPGDELAQKRYGAAQGKTEMWYILDAEPDAELISGFKADMTKELYLGHLENRTLKDILNVEKVAAGDTFFIPAGRVHAIGSGILLAEIQQTSDTTYRIYDWDRIGADGLPRDLHTEQALDAIDFSATTQAAIRMEARPGQVVTLVDCPQFITRMRHVSGRMALDFSALDSFVSMLCIDGEVEISSEFSHETLKKGEVILLPAFIKSFELKSDNAKMLETYCS